MLNENGLADQAIRYEDHYYSDVLPSPGTLKTIGQSLGVDAILQGEIVDFRQTDGVFDRNKGKTRVTVHYSMIGIASGKLQWEASSDGSVTTLTTAELGATHHLRYPVGAGEDTDSIAVLMQACDQQVQGWNSSAPALSCGNSGENVITPAAMSSLHRALDSDRPVPRTILHSPCAL